MNPPTRSAEVEFGAFSLFAFFATDEEMIED